MTVALAKEIEEKSPVAFMIPFLAHKLVVLISVMVVVYAFICSAVKP